MSAGTHIQWSDNTANIFVPKIGGWWCRKISDGCKNCYASTLNVGRFGNGLPYSGEAPEMVIRSDIISGWSKLRKPKMHFVASMTDVFGEWLQTRSIFEMLDGMAAAPLQTFQVLTKRDVVMRDMVKKWLELRDLYLVPENIWLGVSIETQEFVSRARTLLQIPAVIRWVSFEPALGPINLRPYLGKNEINWVVVGGESGNGARPFHELWAEQMLMQCVPAGVPVFVKQMGSRPVDIETRQFKKYKHPKGGEISEWRESLQVRQFPKAPVLQSELLEMGVTP